MLRSFAFVLLIVLQAADLLSQAGPWVQKSSLPGPGRHRGFSFVVGNKAYVGGGWNGWIMYNDCWEFDPSTNSWTQRASTPTASAYTCTGGGIGTKGYICLGTLNTILLEYNPATNTWSQKAPCPISQYWESSALIYNDKLYIPATNVMYVYDPTLNSWQSQPTTGMTGWYGPSVTIGNFAYTVFSSGNQTWKFNYLNNTWSQAAVFPGETRNQAIAFAASGKVYAGTGDGAINDNLNDFWEYDPVMNSWKQIDDMPAATRENSTAFTLNGRGHVCTGTNGTNMQDLWMLIPEQITGIDENPVLESNVFPNPVQSNFTMSLNVFPAKGTVLRIFQADGKSLLSVPILEQHTLIQRGSLPAGIYFYSLESDRDRLSSGKLLFE